MASGDRGGGGDAWNTVPWVASEEVVMEREDKQHVGGRNVQMEQKLESGGRARFHAVCLQRGLVDDQ
jgi:hypothetical protein